MFFDIIKKDSDNSAVDAEYLLFKNKISNVKEIKDSIEKEAYKILEDLKDIYDDDTIEFDEVIETMVFWLYGYSDTPLTEAQKNMMTLFYGSPTAYRPSRHDKTVDIILALLLETEYMHGSPFRTLKRLTYDPVLEQWNTHISNNRDLLHTLENTGSRVDKRAMTRFLNEGFLDTLGRDYKNFIEQIDNWYTTVYNKFTTMDDVDLLNSFFSNFEPSYEKRVMRGSTIDLTPQAINDLKPQISEFKELLFDEINKYLNQIPPAEKILKEGIKIIAQQVKKMDELFGSLRNMGADVKINHRPPSPGSTTGIKITMGEYQFSSRLASVLSPQDCPQLEHLPTDSTICIQQKDDVNYPLFDSLFTILALVHVRQKGHIPMLDYFIYFTDLGITVDAVHTDFIQFELSNLNKEQRVALQQTVTYFRDKKNNPILGSGTQHGKSLTIRAKRLPDINTFINRFRRERKRVQRNMEREFRGD